MGGAAYHEAVAWQGPFSSWIVGGDEWWRRTQWVAGGVPVGWYQVRLFAAIAAAPLLVASSAAEQGGSPPGNDGVSARVSVAEIDNAARAHLERADAFLANGQLSEAIDTVRRVMDSATETLVVADPLSSDGRFGFVRYVTVRRFCHQWLARLHETAPEALRVYRNQVDPLAEQWFRQAETDNDPRWLQRIVDEFFLSSVGDQTLLRLGSHALERGDYRHAREYWERISARLRFPGLPGNERSVSEGRPLGWVLRGVDLDTQWDTLAPLLEQEAVARSWLAYPDSALPTADVRARLVLVSILEGDLSRAGLELDLLERLEPEATGTLGGRSGQYVELLDALLEESRTWPAPSFCTDWPTFAGHPSRHTVAPRPVDMAGEPAWSVELPRLDWLGELRGAPRLRVGESADGLLSYHPVVADGLVVIRTGIRESDVEGIDLQTGRVVFPRGENPLGYRREVPWRTASGVPRFTLTIDGTRAYARVGSPITGSRLSDNEPVEPPSKLVALDLTAQRRLALEIKLEGPEWRDWAFEGSPLVEGSRLYVALRRRDSVRAEAHVACFDARQGRLIWRRFLCAAEAFGKPQPHEITHTLLTLDQGTLFCSTNLGAVAAVAAASGEIQWLTTYPRTVPRYSDPDWDDRYLFRDLNPCLVYRDLVFAAPTDCGSVIALDAITGRPCWMTDADQLCDVNHLLGVGDDRLLASGDGLYWLDPLSGRLLGQFPRPTSSAPGHARPNPRSWGRGVLAGSHVYWPTRDAIYVLEQRTLRTPYGWEPVLVREIPLRPRGASGGNLVIADGMLLVATADRLYAFSETGRFDDDRRGRRSGSAGTERSVSANYP